MAAEYHTVALTEHKNTEEPTEMNSGVFIRLIRMQLHLLKKTSQQEIISTIQA